MNGCLSGRRLGRLLVISVVVLIAGCAGTRDVSETPDKQADVYGQQGTGIVSSNPYSSTFTHSKANVVTNSEPDNRSATPTQVTDVNSAPVFEALPDQPKWAVGDRWVWSDGYGLEVVSVDAAKTRMQRTDDPEQWQLREGFFTVESQSKTTRRRLLFRSEDPAEIFPLKEGNRVVFRREYLANGELKIHNTSWIVQGRELIRVPAGEFDTWVLERRTRSTKTDWTGYEKIWFAPEVRNYVRMEYRYGLAPAGIRVLMAYRVLPE